MQRRKVWMGELKYIVMDGCMLLNKISIISGKTTTKNKNKLFYSVVPELWKTEKSSQTKLATGACKKTKSSLPGCWQLSASPVTIVPQCRAPVAGQPDPVTAVIPPCCSCSFFWTRDAYHKFSRSYDMVELTAGLFVAEHLDWTFEVNTKMARQQ